MKGCRWWNAAHRMRPRDATIKMKRPNEAEKAVRMRQGGIHPTRRHALSNDRLALRESLDVGLAGSPPFRPTLAVFWAVDFPLQGRSRGILGFEEFLQDGVRLDAVA